MGNCGGKNCGGFLKAMNVIVVKKKKKKSSKIQHLDFYPKIF